MAGKVEDRLLTDLKLLSDQEVEKSFEKQKAILWVAETELRGLAGREKELPVSEHPIWSARFEEVTLCKKRAMDKLHLLKDEHRERKRSRRDLTAWSEEKLVERLVQQKGILWFTEITLTSLARKSRRKAASDDAARYADAISKRKQAKDEFHLLRNELNERELSRQQSERAKLVRRNEVDGNEVADVRTPAELLCLQGALYAATEKLEALKESGGGLGMRLEDLDALRSSAMAVVQLVEKGKERTGCAVAGEGGTGCSCCCGAVEIGGGQRQAADGCTEPWGRGSGT